MFGKDDFVYFTRMRELARMTKLFEHFAYVFYRNLSALAEVTNSRATFHVIFIFEVAMLPDTEVVRSNFFDPVAASNSGLSLHEVFGSERRYTDFCDESLIVFQSFDVYRNEEDPAFGVRTLRIEAVSFR